MSRFTRGGLRLFLLSLLPVLVVLVGVTKVITLRTIPPSTPTPTPVATPLSILLRIDQNIYMLDLKVDATGLIKNSQHAIEDVKSQVENDSTIQGRRAALVIPFGGTPTGQDARAIKVASKVVDILKSLGEEGFVFIGTIYHDPLNYRGKDISFVEIQIYFYAQNK